MRMTELTFDLGLVPHLRRHGVLCQYCVHLWYLVQVSAIASPDHKLDLCLLLGLLQTRMLALWAAMLESRVSQSSASLLLLGCCKLFLVFLVCKYIVVE